MKKNKMKYKTFVCGKDGTPFVICECERYITITGYIDCYDKNDSLVATISASVFAFAKLNK